MMPYVTTYLQQCVLAGNEGQQAMRPVLVAWYSQAWIGEGTCEEGTSDKEASALQCPYHGMTKVAMFSVNIVHY
jgi:hypothetical protein